MTGKKGGPKLDLQRAVIVPKETKLEYDLRRLGWTVRRLKAWYRESADHIFESHGRQIAVRKRLLALLPEARVVPRAMVDEADLDRASLVVALGGDNHFVYVSHFLRKAPILGVNADRVRSHGGLLDVDERQLEPTAAALRAGRWRVEEWPRLEAYVDGKLAGLATSEVFLGERQRKHMSRHALRVDRGPEEEHKSSGLLVATPAGSTGWYGHYGRPFKASSGVARWALTEPFPRDRKLKAAAGTLRPGEALRIRSLNDSEGILDIDSLKDAPFPFASVATLQLSSHPLKAARVRL